MTQQFKNGIGRSWRVAPIFLALWLALSSSAASAATYALEIIQPRAGLTTANRYYKAYPGLPYEVNVAAIGGTYPYTFALTTAPSGMTVDAASGRINWASPAAQSSAYPVSVRVTDSGGASTSVSWSVLVTTDGFKFVDAVNGKTASQGGTGSQSNPWKTMGDWYAGKYDTANRGAFVYYRQGTYRTVDAPIEDSWRLAMAANNKPLVWLAYPGEAPVIDTAGSHISIYSGSDNAYFDGLTFQNFTTNFGISIESSGNNVVFRKNTFKNLPAGSGGTGTNASALMINRGNVGRYWTIIDNQFSGVRDVGYGILGYNTDRTLVQGNKFSDFTVSESKAIGPKMGNSMWFIRDNRINLSSGQGIWVDTYSSGTVTTKDIEISYNLVQVANGKTLWIGQEPATYGSVTSFRNTYVGAAVTVDNLSSSSGPVSFDRDVILNSATTANKIGTTVSSLIGQLTSLLRVSNLLTGTTSSGIVDASGNLTGSYAQYVGQYGYQRTGATEKTPMPPVVSVQ